MGRDSSMLQSRHIYTTEYKKYRLAQRTLILFDYSKCLRSQGLPKRKPWEIFFYEYENIQNINVHISALGRNIQQTHSKYIGHKRTLKRTNIPQV